MEAFGPARYSWDQNAITVSLSIKAQSRLQRWRGEKKKLKRKKQWRMFTLISLPIEPTLQQSWRLKIHKRITIYKSIIHVCCHCALQRGTNRTHLWVRARMKTHSHSRGLGTLPSVDAVMSTCVWPGMVPSLSTLQCAGTNTCLTQQIGTNGFTHNAICKLDCWLERLLQAPLHHCVPLRLHILRLAAETRQCSAQYRAPESETRWEYGNALIKTWNCLVFANRVKASEVKNYLGDHF